MFNSWLQTPVDTAPGRQWWLSQWFCHYMGNLGWVAGSQLQHVLAHSGPLGSEPMYQFSFCLMISFSLKGLFSWRTELQRIYIYWFSLQMATMSWTVPPEIQGERSSPRFSMWVAGDQVLEPFAAAFPGTLVGNGMGRGKARHLNQCQRCWRWVAAKHNHGAGPV